jgi:excisionase family DNA binding protein
MLGISKALAFRWMQDGTLPTVRTRKGRTVRVPEEALHAWIRANAREALPGTKVLGVRRREQQ